MARDRFDLNINADEFLSKIKLSERRAMDGAEKGMTDVVNELVRIASEITPFDKGTLRKSHTSKIIKKAGDIEGEVTFSVKEGDFNYALWIHEGVYELGEESEEQTGTSGWSGKSYDVGRKYLERPMKGEERAFKEHIANVIKNELGD